MNRFASKKCGKMSGGDGRTMIIVSPEHCKVAFKKSVSKFIDAPVMIIRF
jgi:hypothetical protein